MYNLVNFHKSCIHVTTPIWGLERCWQPRSPSCFRFPPIWRGARQSSLGFLPLPFPSVLTPASLVFFVRPAVRETALSSTSDSLKGHLFPSLLPRAYVDNFPRGRSPSRCPWAVPTAAPPWALTGLRLGTSAGLRYPRAGGAGLVWVCLVSGFSS